MIHVFRAKVQQMVQGMDDTVVIAVEAKSAADAARKVIQQDSDRYASDGIDERFWERDGKPAHTFPVYLGTMHDLMEDGEVNLSEVSPVQ